MGASPSQLRTLGYNKAQVARAGFSEAQLQGDESAWRTASPQMERAPKDATVALAHEAARVRQHIVLAFPEKTHHGAPVVL